MTTIVFVDRASLPVPMRAPGFTHVWREFPRTEPAQLHERIRDANVIIANKVPLREPTLAAAPQLDLIVAAATGTDHIDLEYCRQRGIAVANVRGYAEHSVPEHVFALAFALRRNLFAYRRDVAAGLWNRSDQFCLLSHPIEDLHGSTLGVIGFGVLGRAVAQLANCFGMRVLVADHKNASATRPGFAPFDEVLRLSDVVTLHAPLNPDTRHLIGARELELMRPNALLINTARGGLVDEVALADSLRSQRIAGAGFDVLSSEPPSTGNPLLELDLPNFVLTPHVAWGSDSAMRNLAEQVVAAIEAFAAGREMNRVI